MLGLNMTLVSVISVGHDVFKDILLAMQDYNYIGHKDGSRRQAHVQCMTVVNTEAQVCIHE